MKANTVIPTSVKLHGKKLMKSSKQLGSLVLMMVTQGANVTALRIGKVPTPALQAPEVC